MKPETKESIDAYIATGRPTGDFLRSVLGNNLFYAAGFADAENARDLYAIAQYVFKNAPRAAIGSEEAYQMWIKAGGMQGYMNREAQARDRA